MPIENINREYSINALISATVMLVLNTNKGSIHELYFCTKL